MCASLRKDAVMLAFLLREKEQFHKTEQRPGILSGEWDCMPPSHSPEYHPHTQAFELRAPLTRKSLDISSEINVKPFEKESSDAQSS